MTTSFATTIIDTSVNEDDNITETVMNPAFAEMDRFSGRSLPRTVWQASTERAA